MSDPAFTNEPILAELVLPPANGCGSIPPHAQIEFPTSEETSTLGLVELILKNPQKADLLALLPRSLGEVVPRLLSIAVMSYLFFGATFVLLLHLAPVGAQPHRWFAFPAVGWLDRSGLALVLGYTLGLVAASGICLPSFYFFGLLSGVRLTMLQIVAIVVRAKATSALVLVGILPIYLALVLGMLIFKAAPEHLELCFYFGLALPFVAGLEGVRSIYRGVQTVSAHQPDEWRASRFCFLRRLTLSWAACYTVVSPVMVYRLWESIGGP